MGSGLRLQAGPLRGPLQLSQPRFQPQPPDHTLLRAHPMQGPDVVMEGGTLSARGRGDGEGGRLPRGPGGPAFSSAGSTDRPAQNRGLTGRGRSAAPRLTLTRGGLTTRRGQKCSHGPRRPPAAPEDGGHGRVLTT